MTLIEIYKTQGEFTHDQKVQEFCNRPIIKATLEEISKEINNGDGVED